MKIQLVSDTHFDQYPPNSRFLDINPEADVIVLAGDVSSDERVFKSLISCIRSQSSVPVIFVLGNYDFYGHDLDSSYARFRSELGRFEDVFILDRAKVMIKEKGSRRSVKFVGGTLWTDFEFCSRIDEISSSFFDYKNIFKYGRLITSSDILSEFNSLVEYLKSEVDENTVVVTHHGPSYLLIPPEYQCSVLNGGYVSNCEWVIENKKPLAWLFGHFHNRISAKIGPTLCECNPYGTPYERSGYRLESLQYDSKLLIEV